MALENLKENIEREKEIVRELAIFSSQLKNLEKFLPYEKKDTERRILTKAIGSSLEIMRILNSSIPSLLEAISPYKSLEKKEEKIEQLVKISYPKKEGKEKVSITIEKKDKEKFLKELNLSRETLKRLAKESRHKAKVEFLEFKKPSYYARISNKVFFKLSDYFIKKEKFQKLNLKQHLHHLLIDLYLPLK